jgi:hypothetical protein
VVASIIVIFVVLKADVDLMPGDGEPLAYAIPTNYCIATNPYVMLVDGELLA